MINRMRISCVRICLSVCLSFWLSPLCQSVSRSVRQAICLSVWLCVCVRYKHASCRQTDRQGGMDGWCIGIAMAIYGCVWRMCVCVCVSSVYFFSLGFSLSHSAFSFS